MPLHSLELRNLGPFIDVAFQFDDQINLLVGPNNCGKSTALWALGYICVTSFGLPKKLLREKAGFKVAFANDRTPDEIDGMLPFGGRVAFKKIELTISLGFTCFVPALRRSTDFRSKSASRETNGKRESSHIQDPVQMEDAEMIQSIIDLDYRSYREKRPGIRAVIQRIASIASEITEGFPLEFAGVGEDDRGLYPRFKTPDGEMPLNSLSQGTQSILQWLGHLLINMAKHYDYPDDFDDKKAVLIIDEIDAHLHPSWQRRILPALTKAFPRLQIFCSSHSPLMLAGLKAGQVHLLQRDAKNRVVVSRNETDIVGWSVDEILRAFLDVPDPTDLETSEKIQRLQALRHKKRHSARETVELESLRKTLSTSLSTGPATDKVLTLATELVGTPRKKPRNGPHR